jgi:hypothetical protein
VTIRMRGLAGFLLTDIGLGIEGFHSTCAEIG